MEYWDIYDAEKRLTGRTMKRNDWCLKDGGIPSDSAWSCGKTGWNISDHETCNDKSVGTVGGKYPAVQRRQESLLRKRYA